MSASSSRVVMSASSSSVSPTRVSMATDSLVTRSIWNARNDEMRAYHRRTLDRAVVVPCDHELVNGIHWHHERLEQVEQQLAHTVCFYDQWSGLAVPLDEVLRRQRAHVPVIGGHVGPKLLNPHRAVKRERVPVKVLLVGEEELHPELDDEHLVEDPRLELLAHIELARVVFVVVDHTDVVLDVHGDNAPSEILLEHVSRNVLRISFRDERALRSVAQHGDLVERVAKFVQLVAQVEGCLICLT